MAFGNWEAVIKEYEEIYLPSRYAERAKGMLKLIPLLRTQLELENVLPGSSHGTLFQTFSFIRPRVFIVSESNNSYTVYIGSGSEYSDEITVGFDEVIPIVNQYLKKISAIRS